MLYIKHGLYYAGWSEEHQVVAAGGAGRMRRETEQSATRGRPGRRPAAVTAHRAAGAEPADIGPQALIHADAHGSILARPG